ncbi:GTP-binding protein Rheb homolog isoform X1 [Schistocerca gregaria]|uniref:GTP-binding protein Rheb homolog isoform X1 n=1 Tax=Schistocerca gregaria TaxID=7010 RepID=UPI00211F398B|nr:GTP-binding protein Rheb homolog isoform X1 [Schistocerca gregaria]
MTSRLNLFKSRSNLSTSPNTTAPSNRMAKRPNEPPKMQKQRRVAVMGFRAVGKTSVTVQFAEKGFSEDYHPSIENTFHIGIKVNGKEYEIEIIDTAGQDEYSLLQRQYTVGMHGYVLVYSIANKYSFDIVKNINDQILNALGTEKVPRVLVGNQKDLVSQREVSLEDGQALAQRWGCAFTETSAKLNENISKVFAMIIEEIQKDSAPKEPKTACSVM